jgi:hypothetical protein
MLVEQVNNEAFDAGHRHDWEIKLSLQCGTLYLT